MFFFCSRLAFFIACCGLWWREKTKGARKKVEMNINPSKKRGNAKKNFNFIKKWSAFTCWVCKFSVLRHKRLPSEPHSALVKYDDDDVQTSSCIAWTLVIRKARFPSLLRFPEQSINSPKSLQQLTNLSRSFNRKTTTKPRLALHCSEHFLINKLCLRFDWKPKSTIASKANYREFMRCSNINQTPRRDFIWKWFHPPPSRADFWFL